MDPKSRHASTFLNALADTNQDLIELTWRLQSRSDVARVLQNLGCRKYTQQVILEGYVDAELGNGKGVTWWLEISWDSEHWIIESSVLLNDSPGDSSQRTIRAFPERRASTLDECIEELALATSDLISSADSVMDTLTA